MNNFKLLAISSLTSSAMVSCILLDYSEGGLAGTGGKSAGGSTSGGSLANGGAQSGGASASTGGKAGGGGSLTSGGMPAATGGKGLAGTPSTGGETSTGGTSSTGGALATGGTANLGGSLPTGGKAPTGGSPAVNTGGSAATGGRSPTGGSSATGGTTTTGGSLSTGGTTTTGGTFTTGGTLPTGGAMSTGGMLPTGGSAASGGAIATGGACFQGGSGGNNGILGCNTASNPCARGWYTGQPAMVSSDTKGQWFLWPLPAGTWLTWQTVLLAGDTVTELGIFTYLANGETPGTFQLALYSDVGGTAPGTLLASTGLLQSVGGDNACTNNVAVRGAVSTNYVVSKTANFWIVVLVEGTNGLVTIGGNSGLREPTYCYSPLTSLPNSAPTGNFGCIPANLGTYTSSIPFLFAMVSR